MYSHKTGKYQHKLGSDLTTSRYTSICIVPIILISEKYNIKKINIEKGAQICVSTVDQNDFFGLCFGLVVQFLYAIVLHGLVINVCRLVQSCKKRMIVLFKFVGRARVASPLQNSSYQLLIISTDLLVTTDESDRMLT